MHLIFYEDNAYLVVIDVLTHNRNVPCLEVDNYIDIHVKACQQRNDKLHDIPSEDKSDLYVEI